MTLDEAILHAKEVAKQQEGMAWEAELQEEYGRIESCKKCAKEHRQLAEWLKDYKRLLEQESCDDESSAVRNVTTAFQFGIAMGFAKKYDEMDKVMEEVKKITPQQKIGEWIYIGNSEANGLKICECSNCKKRTYGSHKFCPNCGAKMDEVEE